jgi:hypothetical protein
MDILEDDSSQMYFACPIVQKNVQPALAAYEAGDDLG